MTTITTDDVQAHLARYLAAVERGEEFIIARDEQPVARLIPVAKDSQGSTPARQLRPRVGETLDAPFVIPDSAFAPLTVDELKEWGL